jgi:hypothetical protein
MILLSNQVLGVKPYDLHPKTQPWFLPSIFVFRFMFC